MSVYLALQCGKFGPQSEAVPAEFPLQEGLLHRDVALCELRLAPETSAHISCELRRIVVVVLVHRFGDLLKVRRMGDGDLEPQPPQHPVDVLGFGRVLDEDVDAVVPHETGEFGHSSVVGIEPAESLVEPFQEFLVSGSRFALSGELGESRTFLLVHIYSDSDLHLSIAPATRKPRPGPDRYLSTAVHIAHGLWCFL